MDGESLKPILKKQVVLRKKDDTTLLHGFVKEIYLDSILFITNGQMRLIAFDQIAEIRETNKKTPSLNGWY